MEALRGLVARLLDVIAPRGCSACDAPCEAPFCAACGEPVRLDETGFIEGVPLVVAGRYEPPLSTAIARFKYEGRADLVSALASLLQPKLAALPLPAEVTFVPVPLHPKRLATRGYNQAALLAQELAARLGRTAAPRFLRRVRETERQVGKARSLRLTNLEGAFEISAASRARYIVLVDDVVTTGSTVRACAQALAGHDVRLVAVAALARTVADSAD